MYEAFTHSKARLRLFQVLYFTQKIAQRRLKCIQLRKKETRCKGGSIPSRLRSTDWLNPEASRVYIGRLWKRGLSLRDCGCHQLLRLQRLHSKAVYSRKWVGKSHGKGKQNGFSSWCVLGLEVCFLHYFLMVEDENMGRKIQLFGPEIQGEQEVANLFRKVKILTLGVCFHVKS